MRPVVNWLALASPSGPAAAQQAQELRVGIGFGIGFLPFFVAEAQHMFEQQAQATPEAPALTCGEVSLSYAQLDARAAHLAARLRARGLGPEQVVAVALPRSADSVVALTLG